MKETEQNKIEIQLTLEQHRFELCRLNYMQILFNGKYRILHIPSSEESMNVEEQHIWKTNYKVLHKLTLALFKGQLKRV